MTQDNDNEKLQAQIDQNLKRVYQDVLKEPVPERFQELLDQLRQKDGNK